MRAMELADEDRFLGLEEPGRHLELTPGIGGAEMMMEGLTSAAGKQLNGQFGPIYGHSLDEKGEHRCRILLGNDGFRRIRRENLKTFAGVWQTNGFQWAVGKQGEDESPGGTYTGLFSVASRFNHSCVPNVHYEHVRLPSSPRPGAADVMILYALRDIEEGEELTLNYGSTGGNKQGENDWHVGTRRARLRRKYGFVCDCALCMIQSNSSSSS